MNSNLRLIAALAVLLNFVFLVSCDDEPEKDTVNPAITIVSPTQDDLLKGTAVVKVVIEELKLSIAEVFIDGNPVGESTENEFEVSIDTKKIDDGKHELTVTAVDAEGNTAEVSMEVEVRNTLLKFSVPANHIYPNEELWFFATTMDGELISSLKAENSSIVTLPTSENLGKNDEFVLHKVSYRFEADFAYGEYNVESYANLSPGGEYFILPVNREGDTAPEIGQHKLTITNKPNDYFGLSIVGRIGQVTRTISGSTTTVNTSLLESGSSLLYIWGNQINVDIIPKYKLYNNVTPGLQSTANFSTDFTLMNVSTIPVEGATGSLSFYHYILDPITKTRRFIQAQTRFNQSSFKVPYPGNVFEKNVTELSAGFSGQGVKYYTKVGSMPSTFKTISASVTGVTVAGSSLSIKTSGTADYVYGISHEYWKPGTNEYLLKWLYYMDPAKEKKVTIPSFPANLLAAHPQLSQAGVKFDAAGILEVNSVYNYNDLLTMILKPIPDPDSAYDEKVGTVMGFPNTGGRTKSGRMKNPGDIRVNPTLWKDPSE